MSNSKTLSPHLPQELNGPCREKYWDECTADERIERLCREAKSLHELLTAQAGMIAELRCHEHAPNGVACIPLVTTAPNIGRSRGIPWALCSEAERR